MDEFQRTGTALDEQDRNLARILGVDQAELDVRWAPEVAAGRPAAGLTPRRPRALVGAGLVFGVLVLLAGGLATHFATRVAPPQRASAAIADMLISATPSPLVDVRAARKPKVQVLGTAPAGVEPRPQSQPRALENSALQARAAVLLARKIRPRNFDVARATVPKVAKKIDERGGRDAIASTPPSVNVSSSSKSRAESDERLDAIDAIRLLRQK